MGDGVINQKKCNYIKNFICLLIFTFYLVSCFNDNNVPWQIDVEYSLSLTSGGNSYKSLNAENPYKTVDEIRIYKIVKDGRGMYSLTDLFKEELIYKSTDKKFIKKFILAAQELIREVPGVRKKRNIENYHIVMLDNSKMRAGCFIYCTRIIGNDLYGEIKSYQPGSSFYHNKALLPIFKELNVL